jgi:hypothetical protein
MIANDKSEITVQEATVTYFGVLSCSFISWTNETNHTKAFRDMLYIFLNAEICATRMRQLLYPY